MDELVNKVAQSGLIVLDLKEYLPEEDDILEFDIKDFLFQELLLREKDFREAMKTYDWSKYNYKYVAVTCSSEAIVPMWAYMLIASYLENIAEGIAFATKSAYMQQLLVQEIQEIDLTPYVDGRVIIKGCGDASIYEGAFLAITRHLQPVVKTLMYGEPCSTVPIFKRK